MAVAIRPGWTEVTRSAGSSARSESAKARSANLLAEYDASPGEALIPDAGVDEHDVPPRCAQRGQQLQRQRDRADHVDRQVARHSSTLVSATRPGYATPGVVDQHVELDDRLDDGGDRVGIAEVDGPGGGAEALGDGVQPIRRATRQQQRVGRSQRVGERGSEAAGRPR